MTSEVAKYSDIYLDIFEDHIVLKGYYFLKFGKRRISFSEISDFKEVRLTYFNGLTRHEQVWMKFRWPFDWKVKDRKEAFYIKPKGAMVGIGVSAENPREVSLLIHKKLHGTLS